MLCAAYRPFRPLLLSALCLLLALGLLLYHPAEPSVSAVSEATLPEEDLVAYYSEHLVIKYLISDEKFIDFIAQAGEQAYTDVVKWFNYEPDTPVTVIVYPDTVSLAQRFSWPASTRSMGVYWQGNIYVLSPAAWDQVPSYQQFCREGPMTHELTHLLVDELSGGQHARWFTEGLAQYLEHKYQGSSPWGMAVEVPDTFSFHAMERGFAASDYSDVYVQARQTVEYLAQRYGEDRLRAVLPELAAGQTTEAALEKTLGVEASQLETECREFMD